MDFENHIFLRFNIDSLRIVGEYDHEPLMCLYDHSCYEAELIAKNELNLNVILTAGKYELHIFTVGSEIASDIQKDTGLNQLPFSFELQAVPVY
jgi:hypothetical protein